MLTTGYRVSAGTATTTTADPRRSAAWTVGTADCLAAPGGIIRRRQRDDLIDWRLTAWHCHVTSSRHMMNGRIQRRLLKQLHSAFHSAEDLFQIRLLLSSTSPPAAVARKHGVEVSYCDRSDHLDYSLVK